MKILAPTDFSEQSLNAINWALEYLEQFDVAEIQILHCLQARRRADMFMSIDDILMEQAEKDIERLRHELHKKAWNAAINISLFKVEPKEFIPEYAVKISADLIVAGSKGLTSLKDMTIGSVTEQIARKSEVPLIIIPENVGYKRIESVVLGVNEKLMEEPTLLDPLPPLLSPNPYKLIFAEVGDERIALTDFENAMKNVFEGVELVSINVPLDINVAKSLNNYAHKVNADMLVIGHQRRSWLGRLFHHSIMKEGLFNLQLPVCIMPI